MSQLNNLPKDVWIQCLTYLPTKDLVYKVRLLNTSMKQLIDTTVLPPHIKVLKNPIFPLIHSLIKHPMSS